jgi:hypothetical protein
MFHLQAVDEFAHCVRSHYPVHKANATQQQKCKCNQLKRQLMMHTTQLWLSSARQLQTALRADAGHPPRKPFVQQNAQHRQCGTAEHLLSLALLEIA